MQPLLSRGGLLAVQLLVVLTWGLALLGAALLLANRSNAVPASDFDLDQMLGEPAFMWAKVLASVLFAVAGWLLATRRPRSLVGYATLTAGLANAIGVVGGEWVVLARVGGHGLPLLDAGLWLGSWPYAVEPLVLVTLYWLFPRGDRAGGWTGLAGALAVVLSGLGLLASIVAPIQLDPSGPFAGLAGSPLPVRGPSGLDGLIGVGLLLGSGVLVVRWLRSDQEDRRAFRTLAVVALVGFALPLLPVSTVVARLMFEAHTVVLLLVVLASILRHQLYGVELVLNRTLVYLSLSGLVAGVYAALIGLIALLGLSSGGSADVPAAIVAALCLLPARERVQRLVNRFLYGYRDEPFAVVTRVAAQLENSMDPEQQLKGLLETIVHALRLPAAELILETPDGAARRMTVGSSSGAPDRFSLVYQGESLGELAVTRRAGQTALGADESRLLTHVAAQAAVAAQAVRLRQQLLRSRERVVAVAEEERRRLRRDLHDGLGPLLTAACSRVDACRGFLGRDDVRVDVLLGEIRGDMTEGLADLRRLVYSLRPVVLDELGFLEALRQLCHRSAVPVVADLPETLPSLPAAVEITAYRIVAEALTNVTRHANATACRVRVHIAGQLFVEVADNGTSTSPWRSGVGLSSMRERATEVGGSWDAGPAETGGGQVHAALPIALAGLPA